VEYHGPVPDGLGFAGCVIFTLIAFGLIVLIIWGATKD